MKKLHIFTLVSGASYVSHWKRAGAVSLLWPENLAALKGMDVFWDVYTDHESSGAVSAIAKDLPFAHQITVTDFKRDDAQLRVSLEKAFNERAYFMPAPPDLIWGDGSIAAMLKMMQFAYGRCIAVPHVRVAAGRFLSAWTGEKLTNGQLVTKAFAALHEAFRGSEVPSDKSNVNTTGTYWTKLGANLYATGFFLPTIHLMQPKEEDVKWFKTTPGRDHWDHRFPASLVGTDRHRLIGSSDAAFMCELTADDEFHPQRHPTIKGKWDEYNGTMAHHIQNRNTVAIFRGEPC